MTDKDTPQPSAEDLAIFEEVFALWKKATKKLLSFRLDETTHDILRWTAAHERRSQADIIELAVREYFKARYNNSEALMDIMMWRKLHGDSNE